MGYPPPPDAPTPTQQAEQEAASSFGPSPTGADICGFSLPQIPAFPGFPGVNLPGLDALLAFPPAFSFPIPITCSTGEDFAESVGYGGGRSPSPVTPIDAEFEND